MQCERSYVANYTHEARGWSEKDRWCPRTKKLSVLVSPMGERHGNADKFTQQKLTVSNPPSE